MSFLSEDTLISVVTTYTSANTTDVNSTGVDMAGFDGVLFIARYGTAAADNLIHAEQSSDDGSVDTYTDIAGSEPNSAGASSEIQFVDIINPQERYVRCVAVRGTSSTVEQITAIRYKARSKPQDNNTAGTIEGERLVQPIAGTK